MTDVRENLITFVAAVYGGNDISLQDEIKEYVEAHYDEVKDGVFQWLNKLKPMEKTVITEYNGLILGKKLGSKQLSETLGVPREKIRAIEEKGWKKLHKRKNKELILGKDWGKSKK